MGFCYYIPSDSNLRARRTHISAPEAVNVKNLGWILRHWQDVASAEWADSTLSSRHWDGHVTFHAKDGADWTEYHTSWACLDVFLSWVHRPVFRGLPLLVNGQKRLA